MEIMDAIYHRRSVRRYTSEPVPKEKIMALLEAAIQAPSAVNQQPWAFVVVRGRKTLDAYSERAKAYMLATLPQALSLHRRSDTLANAEYNAFHGAGTMIAIYAKPAHHNPMEDCCMAGQNLLLAAHGMGLGSCPVGFVRPWLNLSDIKYELGIPASYTAVLPIVVGWPAGETVRPPRVEAEIACWHEDRDEKPASP